MHDDGDDNDGQQDPSVLIHVLCLLRGATYSEHGSDHAHTLLTMNSVNNSLRAAKDSMLPAAFRRKSDATAGKKSNAAGLAALTKEETSTPAQSVVATTSPAPAAPAPSAEKTTAAPQRPPPRPSEAGAVPQLNRYVRSQLPKGEVRIPVVPLAAEVHLI